MGASQSNLSAPGYGYDYVLAVTQDSLNAAAVAFLHSKQPTVNVCYIYDDNGAPKRIAYADFKKSAGGIDPFDIPTAEPARTNAIKQLDDAFFMFGFQAALGLPAGFDVAALPPVITLGAKADDPAIFRLLCRSMVLVELTQIPHRAPLYKSYAQPKGPAGQPWVFAYEVDLLHQPVTDVKQFVASPAFAGLPDSAKNKVTSTPDAFSIRQLLYDFEHASCTARPEITGVSGLLREELYANFSIEWFTEMAGAGAAVVALVPKGNDPLAGLQSEFSINPNPAHPGLACINYLCATADHTLPAPTSFAWNWLEPGEQPAGEEPYDGVCVLNRSRLVTKFRTQFADYVQRNKWVPDPVIVEVYFITYKREFGVTPRDRDWHGSPPDNLQILVESLESPASGPVLLEAHFKSAREYDYASGSSWMRGETTFDLKVTCHGNQIVVEQHALVWCKLVLVTFDRHEWNLVDLTLTDTFTLSTSHDGRIVVDRSSSSADNSATVGGDFAVPDLQGYFTRVQSQVKQRVTSAFVDIPLSVFDDVVFPGGRSFLFKAVTFSDYQDLVAHITYSDPT